MRNGVLKVKNKKSRRRRFAPGSIRVDGNVRCQRVYPTEVTGKSVSDLKTIGFKLSRDQAIHLARVLLAVSQEWDDVDVTGYRFGRRKSDGTYQLTVTTAA
jgi:hypothetical protein